MHDHNHNHNHGHDHDHGHSHDHTHSHETAGSDSDKLKKLMDYWIDHNNDHIDDNEKWLKKTEEMGLGDVALDLKEVTKLLKEVNKHIESARTKLS